MFLDCLEKTHSPISELVSAIQQRKKPQKNASRVSTCLEM